MKKIGLILLFFTLSALCIAFPNFTCTLPGEGTVIFFENIAYSESVSPENISFYISNDNIATFVDEEGTRKISISDEEGYRILKFSDDYGISIYYINMDTWIINKAIEIQPYIKEIVIINDNGECVSEEAFTYDDSKIEEHFGNVLQEDYPSAYLVQYYSSVTNDNQITKTLIYYPDETNPDTIEYQAIFSDMGILSETQYTNGILIYECSYEDFSFGNYTQNTYDSQGNLLYIKTVKDYKAVERTDGISTWTYPEFSERYFRFDDSHFLISSYLSTEEFDEFVELSKTDYVNWNEHYFAEITPYSLVKKSEMHLYLKTFISKNYLVEGSFVYYGKGDSYLYVIPVTDDCIDLDKPGYKVKLVEKPEF